MINKILEKKLFPLLLKIVSLIAFIALMYIGFRAHSTDAVVLKQLRNTNWANLFVWSYWWPLIVVAAIFFGRIWCMVCPVELITSFFAWAGFKNKRPKWLLSGWAIALFFLIILMVGINIFAIHRNPAYMAAYLLTIVAVSVIVGIIYEKNTFCRYVCPVGFLLGIYARLSAWGWRVKDPKTCISCKDKSCVHKKYRYALNTKSCGVDLYPPDIEGNSECIVCAGCLKTCKKYQTEQNPQRPNPGFVKTGFANGLYTGKPLQLAEWFFLFVVSGFVIYEILSEYGGAKQVLLFLPASLHTLPAASNATVQSLIRSLYLFFFLPALFWLLPYGILRLFKTHIPLKKYLIYFGLAFVPIVAAAHFCKAVLKTTSRIPYFEFLGSDISGINTAHAIVGKEILLQPLPVWANGLITAALLFIMLCGFVISIKVINRLIDKLTITQHLLPIRCITLPYFLVFFIDLVIWRLM